MKSIALISGLVGVLVSVLIIIGIESQEKEIKEKGIKITPNGISYPEITLKAALYGNHRHIGFDSVEVTKWYDGEVSSSFIAPNGLSTLVRVDTVFTNDTAFRIFDSYISLAPNIVLAINVPFNISNGSVWSMDKGYQPSNRRIDKNVVWDSLQVDSFKIKIQKVGE